jgi:sporulation protein YqfC
MIKNSYDKYRQLTYSNTAIYITDNTSMIVENCGKIVEYSDIYISLKAKRLNVCVWGKNLKVDDFDNATIRIKGTIQSVEFSR